MTEILNSGARKRGDHWFIGEQELVFPVLSNGEPRKIRRDAELLRAAAQRLGLPPVRAFVSNTTFLVYLSWLDLETIVSDFQDPHPQQYAGTWSEVTVEVLLEQVLDEPWRNGQGLHQPGWRAWSRGRPIPWKQLNGLSTTTTDPFSNPTRETDR